MKLERQKTRVETGGPDEAGCLVFADGKLVAVLVQLSEMHESMAGKWFVEHGFGPLERVEAGIFDDLDAAERWVEASCASAVPGAAGRVWTTP